MTNAGDSRWTCHVCGAVNGSTDYRCRDCLADQPEQGAVTGVPDARPAASFEERSVPAPSDVPPSTGFPTIFCFACGRQIDARAEICPACGVRQPSSAGSMAGAYARAGRDKIVAALLAIFLGSFGIHKFYLGKTAQGVLYLLFFWTGIPGIIGFFEGILYLLKSDEAWAAEYGGGVARETSRVAVGCLIVVAVLVLLGFVSIISLIFLGSQVSTILSRTGAAVTSDATAVPSGIPAPEPGASAASIDTARVGVLMGKVQADPNDIASLSELGDIYFQVGDYKTAGGWMSKILAVDPKNVPALLGLGAADFNQGDAAGAETEWRAVLAIDPKNQEAYYDLGFMYLSETPPDMANVTAMWTKVIEIDPTTDVAKTVKAHLDSFESASASP